MRYQSVFVGLMSFAAIAGCQGTAKNDALERGRTQLQQRDYTAAATSLDAFLKENANGPRAAEAYYLKGHAIQDAKSEDFAEAQSRLQQARLAYIDALKVGTDNRGLEGLIRASLADVAFWQEDYATAAEQGRAAYALLEDPNVRAMALYRSGLSYQRMGRFEEGDRTLKLVTQNHAGTAPATRAQQRIGVRSFSVRIPTESTAAATSAAANLTRQGIAASPAPNEAAVVVGPFSTYTDANAARGKLTPQYPRAVVVP